VLSRDAEVGVSELALDDDRRDALPGHLDGMRVPPLVRSEAASHAGLAGSRATSSWSARGCTARFRGEDIERPALTRGAARRSTSMSSGVPNSA
jgi:hypothetical protein